MPPVTSRPVVSKPAPVVTPAAVTPAPAPAKPAPAAGTTPGTAPASQTPPGSNLGDTFTSGARGVAVVLNPAATPVAPAAAAKPPPAAVGITGEERAKQDVALKDVNATRRETLATQKQVRDEANKQADHLFGIASGKVPLPPNTKILSASDTQVELARTDAKGEILEHSLATRRGAELSVSTASYENGANQLNQTEVGADGSTRVREASWKSPTNEAGKFKSFPEDIDATRDPGLTYTDNSIRTEGEDNWLVNESYSQVKGAIDLSKTVTLEGEGGGGIDDKLEGPFDFDKPVGRSDTYSYSIPAPTQETPNPDIQFSRIQRYSQEHVQATSFVNRKLEDQKALLGEGTPNRHSLENVRSAYIKDDGENYDANDGSKNGNPKRWLVEHKKSPSTLDTQTFVEGTPNATVTTRREQVGNTVKETSSGKDFKPASAELGDVSSDSTTQYAEDGGVEAFDSTSKQADGTALEQKFTSARKATDKGLELSSNMVTRRTKDDQTHTSDLSERSLLSDKGVQLIDTVNKVTGPDGRTAVSTADGKGQHTTLTGPGGKDPRVINSPQSLGDDAVDQDLTLQAHAATATSVQNYAANGGANALGLLHGTSAVLGNQNAPAGTLTSVLGHQKVGLALQGLKGTATALGGAAGAVAGGLNLIQGIRNENVSAGVKGAFDTAVGARSLYVGGKSLVQAFKGVSDLNAAATAAAGGGLSGKLGSALGKLPGATAAQNLGHWFKALPKVSSLITHGASALKALGGVANVVGAVASTAGGIKDIVNGAQGGHDGQIARGTVNVVGGIAGAATGIFAASAAGGPVGLLVGAGIGLATWGIGELASLIADDEHEIADLKID